MIQTSLARRECFVRALKRTAKFGLSLRDFNFPQKMLNACFEMDADLAEKFGGSTGGLVITDENARVVLREKPAPL